MEIFIKSKLEDIDENCDSDAHCNLSNELGLNMSETGTDLIDIKYEPDTNLDDQNEKLLPINKKEIKEESFIEFDNTDVKSIHFVEEFIDSTLKIEENSDDTLYSNIGADMQSTDNENLLYKCDKCDYVTEYKSRLSRHQLTHSEIRPFKCDKCHFRTKSRFYLKSHEVTHQVLRPFKCDKCPFMTKRKILLKLHQKKIHEGNKGTAVHKQEKIIQHCEKCNYSTNIKQNLKRHQQIHKYSAVAAIEPDSQSILSKLLQSTKVESENNLNRLKLEYGYSNQVSDSKCNDFVFPKQCKLEIEVETYDEFDNKDTKSLYLDVSAMKTEDTTSDVTFTSESSIPTYQEKEADIENNLLYQCNKCDYSTKIKSKLTQHETKHSELKPFKCDKCSFRTKTKYALQYHQDVHKEVRPFNCDKCDYSAKNKTRLQRHQLKHTELKPFKCDKCSFSTKREYTLKYHQLVHKDILEVENFSCSKCDYVTKYRRSLASHQLVHADPSQTKTFKCQMCDYEAKQKKYLDKHLLMHENFPEMSFSCKKCNFVTIYKKGLLKHELQHQELGEMETFPCYKCDYKGRSKNNLRQHQLIHKDLSEVETYKCKQCDYVTKYKGNLKGHMATHNRKRI